MKILEIIEDACGGTSPHPAGSIPLEFAEMAAVAFFFNLVFDRVADVGSSRFLD